MKSSMAMLVMSPERRRTLEHNLEPLNVQVLLAGSCQEARILLQNNPPVSVVITDVSLNDGNWCDIFRFLVDKGIHASVVVSSQLADERLWSEVLWRGAYDVLVEPYEADEVRRIIEGALRAAGSRANGMQATASASMN
ncbi:MAG: response regulator [Bryobacterales bacterium]